MRIAEIKDPQLVRCRCSERRSTVYYNDTLSTDKQCTRHAKYIVDGYALCEQHAGRKVLRSLTGEEQ